MADTQTQQGTSTPVPPPETPDQIAAERPKLKLKPRSATAGAAGGFASSGKANPFGAARPREEILKSKGIDVAKIEQELDKRTQRLPRMNKQQQEEYDAAEAEVAFARSELENAENDEAKTAAEEELKQKQKSVEELVEKIRAIEIKPRRAAAANEEPAAGTARPFMRPSERRARREERAMQGGFDNYGSNGAGDFSSFGNRRGAGGGDRTCYNCGQAGHISRNCPSNEGSGGQFSSAFGDRRGGGDRTCYNCGQPGHISRDCPEGGNSGGGNFGGDSFGGGFGGAFGGGNGGRGRDRTCYSCGQPGHMSRDCPEQQGGGGYGGGY